MDRLVGDLRWLGHIRLMLGSDNEPAILKLLTETLKEMRIQLVDQATEGHPPAYDPASNGAAESACKSVGGRLRTMKLDLEARIKQKIPADHPIMGWLVEHAAWIITVSKQMDDGRTPYQLARGSRFHRPMLCFGEY